jgi:transcriptional regulator with XRE-family HTH domain
MNRVLHAARKAKGLTEAQVAKVLKIEEWNYKELEHSVTDVTLEQAIRLSKLYNIDEHLFLYTEGREERSIKSAFDAIAVIMSSDLFKDLSPQSLYGINSIGNTALSLSVQLADATYLQYELKKDNEAIKSVNSYLKERLEELSKCKA